MLGRSSRGPATLQRRPGAHRSASPRLAPLLPPPRLFAPHNGSIHPPPPAAYASLTAQVAGAARPTPGKQRSLFPESTGGTSRAAATGPRGRPLPAGRQDTSPGPAPRPPSLSPPAAPRPKERDLSARRRGVPVPPRSLPARPAAATPQVAQGCLRLCLCPAGRWRGRPAGARWRGGVW